MNASRKVRVHYDILNWLKCISAFEFFIYGINPMILSRLGTAVKKLLHGIGWPGKLSYVNMNKHNCSHNNTLPQVLDIHLL